MQEERDLPGTQHTTSLCTFYHNAFHEAKTKKKKDFQPLTAKRQGSATSKPPMGFRNIATYLTCTMSVVRLPACRWKRTLQPLSEPGFVCGRVRNSEADRVPKSRGQVSSRWVAQPCTACLLDSSQPTACGMSEGNAVMRASASDRLLSMTDTAHQQRGKITQGVDHGPMLRCVTRSPASDLLVDLIRR